MVVDLHTDRPRFRKPNVVILLVISLLLFGSVVLVLSMVLNFPKSSKSKLTFVTNQTASTANSQNNSDGGVTKDVNTDKTPPLGPTILTFSGTGERVSRAVDLNFAWTALWSADCSDRGGSNSLAIQVLASSASPSTVSNFDSSQNILDTGIAASTYQSGTAQGVPKLSAKLEVSSMCDWTVSIIRTDKSATG